ncbi:unnamed protein product [Choristocarpus tenellus]
MIGFKPGGVSATLTGQASKGGHFKPRNGPDRRRTDEEELYQRYKPYRTILGKLMFLAGMTQPDLSNSVWELGRYSASPCDRHWKGLQHVMRYLAGTTRVGIHYPCWW